MISPSAFLLQLPLNKVEVHFSSEQDKKLLTPYETMSNKIKNY